jgi:hypothetical protein
MPPIPMAEPVEEAEVPDVEEVVHKTIRSVP